MINVTIVEVEDDFVCIKTDAKALSFEDVQELKERVFETIDHKSHKIILNLRSIEFMDSVGLSLIISILKYIQVLDGVLKLCALAKQPSELIHIIGLDKLLILLEPPKSLLCEKEQTR